MARETQIYSSRLAITWIQAVCGVGFFANILDICCKNRLAAYPDPSAANLRGMNLRFPRIEFS